MPSLSVTYVLNLTCYLCPEPAPATIKLGFWLGRTEVTVGQWKQFVNETGYVTDGEKNGESHVPRGPGERWGMMKGKSWKDPNFGEVPKDNDAVCCISWNDAMAFCEWMDKQEVRAGRLAQGYAVRLPTESEWEYACRAGRQTKFWWGDSPDDGKGRLNWRWKEGDEFVSPVDSYGERGRNRFGLADMLGNVSEWCLDEYDATQAHEECYQGTPFSRVLRGGSFNHRDYRCASRDRASPNYSICINGFRVCYGVDVSSTKTTTVSTSPATAANEAGVLAPPETRGAARPPSGQAAK